jgi:hypothetical protein
MFAGGEMLPHHVIARLGRIWPYSVIQLALLND